MAPEEILVGAGADEVLDLCAKAFIPAGGAAIVPVPTYPMYGILTDQRRAAVVRIPRHGADAGYALDGDAVRAAAAEPTDNGAYPGLVWLCSPNNPTGRAEPSGAIDRLLSGLLADARAADRPEPTVILDEAYIEFAGESLVGLRGAYPRLVVLRTMSKAYAIAGLRVGFAIARPEVIEEIAIYRPPGSVSIVSVDVATALLADDAVAAGRVAYITEERDSGKRLGKVYDRVRAEMRASMEVSPKRNGHAGGNGRMAAEVSGGPSADAQAIMACMTDGFGKLEKTLAKLANALK